MSQENVVVRRRRVIDPPLAFGHGQARLRVPAGVREASRCGSAWFPRPSLDLKRPRNELPGSFAIHGPRRALSPVARPFIGTDTGRAMSQENVELVRSIYAAWEGGDFSSAEWAHPEIEYVGADGPDPVGSTGLAEMARNFRNWVSTWAEFRLAAVEYLELDRERVLVLDRASGRGKTSGVDLGQIQSEGAWLFCISDGRVRRMVRYLDRDDAFRAVGLSE